MTNFIPQYTARISENAGGEFYALIVRVDRDGEESVIHGYRGRHFKTRKAAEKSAVNYITKHELNIGNSVDAIQKGMN
mgnify:FL=1